MDNSTDNKPELDSLKSDEMEGRRDAIRKLGKYAAYAAPFTVFAANMKGKAAGYGKGGGPTHP